MAAIEAQPFNHEQYFNEEDICILEKIINYKPESESMSEDTPMPQKVESTPSEKSGDVNNETKNIYYITIHHHKENLSLLHYYINQINSLNYTKKYYSNVDFKLYFFTTLEHSTFIKNIPESINKEEHKKKYECNLRYKTINIKLSIQEINININENCNLILHIVNIIPFDIQIAAVEFNISEEELQCEADKYPNVEWNNNKIGTKRFVSQLMIFHEQYKDQSNNYFHWQIDYGTKVGIPYYVNYIGLSGETGYMTMKDYDKFKRRKFAPKRKILAAAAQEDSEDPKAAEDSEDPKAAEDLEASGNSEDSRATEAQQKALGAPEDSKAQKLPNGSKSFGHLHYYHICYAKKFLILLNKLDIKFELINNKVNNKDKSLNKEVTELLLSKFDFILFFMNHYDNRDFMHYTTGSLHSSEYILFNKTSSGITETRNISINHTGAQSGNQYRPNYRGGGDFSMTLHYDKFYISNIKLFLKYRICYNPYLIDSNEDLYLTLLLQNITEKYNKSICSFFFFGYVKCIYEEKKDDGVNAKKTIKSIFLNIYNNALVPTHSDQIKLSEPLKGCKNLPFININTQINTKCSIANKQKCDNYSLQRELMCALFKKHMLSYKEDNNFKLITTDISTVDKNTGATTTITYLILQIKNLLEKYYYNYLYNYLLDFNDLSIDFNDFNIDKKKYLVNKYYNQFISLIKINIPKQLDTETIKKDVAEKLRRVATNIKDEDKCVTEAGEQSVETRSEAVVLQQPRETRQSKRQKTEQDEQFKLSKDSTFLKYLKYKSKYLKLKYYIKNNNIIN
jgi:hypothetical protein